jgi:hypothetical protein
MPGTISVQASIKADNGSFKFPLAGAGRVVITQNGIGGGVPGMITVGPNWEAVSMSELGTPGLVWMRNIDASQSIQWCLTSGAAGIGGIMKPGEPSLVRMDAGVTLYMRVDPATEESGSTSAENQAKAQVFAFED